MNNQDSNTIRRVDETSNSWEIDCFIFDTAFDGHNVLPKDGLDLGTVFEHGGKEGTVRTFSMDHFGFHPENSTIDILDPMEIGDYNPMTDGFSWKQLVKKAILRREVKNDIAMTFAAVVERCVKRVRLEPGGVLFWPDTYTYVVKMRTTHGGRISLSSVGQLRTHSLITPGSITSKNIAAIQLKRQLPGGGKDAKKKP